MSALVGSAGVVGQSFFLPALGHVFIFFILGMGGMPVAGMQVASAPSVNGQPVSMSVSLGKGQGQQGILTGYREQLNGDKTTIYTWRVCRPGSTETVLREADGNPYRDCFP